MAFDKDELNTRRQARAAARERSQRRQRQLRLFLGIAAAVLLLGGSAALIVWKIRTAPDTPPSTEPTPSATQQVPVQTAPLEADRVLHFVVGGDLNITDKTVAAGATASGYDYSAVFLDILPTLAGGDITALNFEGNLFGMPYGTATRSAPPELMQAIRNTGVDLVQSANSLSIANGLLGLRATLQGIREVGLEPLGTFESADAFQKSGGYVIREINGIRIAFVAFTKGMDGAGLPAGGEHCVNLLYRDYNSAYQKVDTAGITAILQSVARQQPDVTVALLHWGSEFNNKVSATQGKIRDLMLENGVDAIIGTHSHYVQQVDFDREKGTLVAYSLGDLLGDADKAGTDYGVVLDLEITKSGATGETHVTDFTYTPVYILDETETGGGMRILRIREAIAAYEANAIQRVPEAVYEAMKSALEKVDSRMNPPPPEETK